MLKISETLGCKNCELVNLNSRLNRTPSSLLLTLTNNQQKSEPTRAITLMTGLHEEGVGFSLTFLNNGVCTAGWRHERSEIRCVIEESTRSNIIPAHTRPQLKLAIKGIKFNKHLDSFVFWQTRALRKR